MGEFVAWLSNTPWSVALRESLLMWPALEAAHVMSIMLFAGTIFMVDLRVLGVVMRSVPFSEFEKRILPLTIAGFLLLVITGLVLVYSKPQVYFFSAFLRIKLVVVAAAMVNILWFHKMVSRGTADWDANAAAPAMVRVSAFLSLGMWLAVIILGRLIAYDWLQCEKLPAGSFLNGFTQCEARISEY